MNTSLHSVRTNEHASGDNLKTDLADTKKPVTPEGEKEMHVSMTQEEQPMPAVLKKILQVVINTDKNVTSEVLEEMLFSEVATLSEISTLLADKIPSALEFDVILGIEEKGSGLAMSLATNFPDKKDLRQGRISIDLKEIDDILKRMIKGKQVLLVCPVLSPSSLKKIRKLIEVLRHASPGSVTVLTVLAQNIHVKDVSNGVVYLQALLESLY